MSLLVLDPDVEVAKHVASQLSDLGFNTTPIDAPARLAELCQKSAARAVVVCSVSGACAINTAITAPVILVLTEPPSVQNILDALPCGVNDIWTLPAEQAQLSERLNQVTTSFERHIAAINQQVASLQSEIERDQRAGQYIQMGMLPPNPMGIGHFRLQHRVEPSLMLSGDFVDYFQITERYFACYVADVAGHGASSAFVTVLLKNFSRRLRREYRPSMLQNPGEVLAWINRELLEQSIDKHVALFFAMVDMQQSKVYYSNAAQFPPAMMIHGETLTDLSQKGKPLGLFPDQSWQAQVAEFPAGARLMICTDGVLDLLPGSTLTDKEAILHDYARQHSELADLWAQLDLSQLGADDVSCLLIEHEL